MAWGLAALLAISTAIALSLGATGYFARPSVERAYRSTVLLPEKAVYTNVGTPAYRLGISPDGSRLSFVASMDGQPPRLWVRPLDALSAQPLAGTEQAAGPFWSPDGRFIAYFTTPLTSLKKIDAAGGPPLTLVELPGTNPNNGSAGATWNKDDVILFGATGPGLGGPIRRVSAAGGTASEVIAPDTKNGETELWYPYFLPDGNHFLFVAMGPLDGLPLRPLGIYVTTLDGKDRKLIMRGGSNVKYTQGHLLFLRESTLMAQAFDAERLELGGDAVPIAEQVQIGGPSGATGPFAVSETGVLAYVSGPALGAGTPSQLVWFGREGQRQGELGDRAAYSDVELSKDGTRATVSVVDPARRSSDIWIYDVARGLRTKFTFDAGTEQASVWSPDGSRIVYSSTRNPAALYENASNGSGSRRQAPCDPTTSGIACGPTSWSLDGRYIAYVSTGAVGDTGDAHDIWVLPLFGDRKDVSVSTDTGQQKSSVASRQMGVGSRTCPPNQGETRSTWRRSPVLAANRSSRHQGAAQPRWRRDGTELFYCLARRQQADERGREWPWRRFPDRRGAAAVRSAGTDWRTFAIRRFT